MEKVPRIVGTREKGLGKKLKNENNVQFDLEKMMI